MKDWKELNYKVSRKLPGFAGSLYSYCQTTDDLIAMQIQIGQKKYRIDQEPGHSIVIDFSQGQRLPAADQITDADD